MNRSTALLRSLSHERDRWEAGSEGFKAQMSTILGDVLLSSAFMSYAGYFDQQMRHHLFTSWSSHLQEAKIQYRHDLALVEVSYIAISIFIYFHYLFAISKLFGTKLSCLVLKVEKKVD